MVSPTDFGVRTCTLRAPERLSRSWIGASRRLSSSVAKIWPLFSIMAASASVLPPAPAHRSTTCSPGLAPENSAANCEPSSCNSTMPLRKAGSAWIAGLLASAASRMRRPQGDQRAGSGFKSDSISATASRSAFSVFTRRSSGARDDKAAPSSARASPKARVKCGSSHSG